MQKILLPALASLTLATLTVAQERSQASVEVGGGKVTIDFTSTKLSGRSPADIPVGTVWRMSKDAAAGLTTTVPLAGRKLLLPPGSYRISARRAGKEKWELLIFQGGMLFEDGMAHHKHSLRLDEETESQEDLAITLKKASRRSGDQVRVRLTWGKHSLNTRFSVLEQKVVDGALGGKPAKFAFYGIPVAGKNQTRLQSGELLTVGTVTQTGPGGLTYSIHAQKSGNDGCDLIFKSVTAKSVDATIASNKGMQKRIQDFMAQASDAQQTRMKQMLEDMAKQLKMLEAQKKAAAALRAKVTIGGNVRTTRETSKNLQVQSEKTDEGVRFAVTFGARVASFVVSDASFQKTQ